MLFTVLVNCVLDYMWLIQVNMQAEIKSIILGGLASWPWAPCSEFCEDLCCLFIESGLI